MNDSLSRKFREDIQEPNKPTVDNKSTEIEQEWFIDDKEMNANPNALEEKRSKMIEENKMDPDGINDQKPSRIHSIKNKITSKIGKLFRRKEKNTQEKIDTNNVISIKKNETTIESDWYSKDDETIEDARKRFFEKHGHSPELSIGGKGNKNNIIEEYREYSDQKAA